MMQRVAVPAVLLGFILVAIVLLSPSTQPFKAFAAPAEDSDPVSLAEAATGLSFEPLVETIPGGEIDWQRGAVIAVGKAYPRDDLRGARAEAMAKRGAYIVAARNAALVLAGIRVGPGGRFENVRSGWIRADVKLTGFRETEASYDPRTRTATAQMEMPLCGLRGAVRILGLKTETPASSWTWPDASGGERIDVIVIDARSAECKPVVLPRLVTADDLCVFDAAQIVTDGTLSRPMACYVRLERTGRIVQAPRAARRCLVLRASGAKPTGVIVLGDPDLKNLGQYRDAKPLLTQGRVVIVGD
jgi:hypothetical protein